MKEYSFWISIISLVIALFSLLWHIYKEFRKPRLKVILLLSPQTLAISVTNRGPGNITIINKAVLKYKWASLKKIFKNNAYKLITVSSSKCLAQITRDSKSLGFPISIFTPPESLAVGDVDILNLRGENINLIKEPKTTNIGILDSTGRIHWASKKEFRRIKKSLK